MNANIQCLYFEFAFLNSQKAKRPVLSGAGLK